MSFIVTGIAQKRSVGSSPRKSVMMLMAACASDDGSGVWVSKANMAADLEMSKRTVQKAITDLIEMGVVGVSGKRPCKNGYTIEYAINLEALRSLKSTRAGDAPVQQVHLTRAGDAPQDVQQVHPNSPRTINEPLDIDNAGEATDIPKQSKKPPDKHRLPDDWIPSDADRDYALSKNLTDNEIEELADDFHAYWTDRTDAGGRKSQRGWGAAWKNRVRDQAPRFIRNRGMAGKQTSFGRGQGSGLAGHLARSRAQGEN